MPRFHSFQRDYKHLILPVRDSKAYFPRFSIYGGGWRRIKQVELRDRIPHWNIVPGDWVRIVSGPPGTKGRDGRVKKVLRRFNVLFLAGRPFQKKTLHKFRSEEYAHHFKKQSVSFDSVPIQYSTVRLIKRETDGTVKVATRVKRGPVQRHPNGMLFWQRWGLFNGVWEEIPSHTKGITVRVRKGIPDGQGYNLTDWQEASKITYRPTLSAKAEILLSGLRATERNDRTMPPEMTMPLLELRRRASRSKK